MSEVCVNQKRSRRLEGEKKRLGVALKKLQGENHRGERARASSEKNGRRNRTSELISQKIQAAPKLGDEGQIKWYVLRY